MINFKNFQEKAISELVATTLNLLNRNEKNAISVFQSPTGSGKTLMMGQFMKELIKEDPFMDLCFLWVSIGKGELHVQSKNKLEKFFQGAPSCSLIEQEFTGHRTEIDKNEVVFVNWEKIRNKDKKTGTWSNVIMKEGEKTSFPQVLANTRKKRKLILIIDESHYGTSSERAKELKEIIEADVMIHVSATPSFIPNALDVRQGKAAYIYVDPQDVIREGLIKKEVIINENLHLLAGGNDLTSLEAVIYAATEKQKQLKNMYENEKSLVNPLILIQIPNSEDGEGKLELVRAILEQNGITEANKKLAIWLSDYKSDILQLTNIADHDNPVECLIFKQAIDTGWDCPRAQILVKLREVKSETFEIQTVGRILRMPEQRHYVHHEDLNRAYIFTNIENIIVKKEEYNPNIIKDLQSVLRNEFEAEGKLNIRSYYRSRADYGSLTKQFYFTFEEAACKKFGFDSNSIDYMENVKQLEGKGFDFSFDFSPQQLDYNLIIEGGQYDEGFAAGDQEGGKAEFKFDDRDIHAIFVQKLKENLGPFAPKRSLSPARMAIYRFFRMYLGSENWENEFRNIQAVFLKNADKFIPVFADAIEAYKAVHAKYVNEKTVEHIDEHYALPAVLYHNRYTEEIAPCQKYAYSPCYLDIGRKQPERNFEEYIDGHEEVKWWWKNGESKKDYLGIKYEYEGQVHTFYPDYIVKTNSGAIGIIEVKDEHDQDGSTLTKAKAEALRTYLQEELKRAECHLFGGIAVFHNRRWIIHTGAQYNWEKTLSHDWSEWDDLDDLLSGRIRSTER